MGSLVGLTTRGIIVVVVVVEVIRVIAVILLLLLLLVVVVIAIVGAIVGVTVNNSTTSQRGQKPCAGPQVPRSRSRSRNP